MTLEAITRRNAILSIAAAAAAVPLPAGNVAWALSQSIARPAPQWDIESWINGDAGNVATLKGKVIVIDFFQLWCPGCNKFSGPLMQHWQQKFKDEIAAGKLVMVKIHTVFEGHDYQSDERLKAYVKEKNITMPVGIDRHEDGARVPVTMRRYDTSGTPEMAVIDANGMIRFQKFGGFDYRPVEALIAELMKEAVAT